MSYFSQSPEISSRALNHGDHCSSASVAFARACRQVLNWRRSRARRSRYKRRPAFFQVLILIVGDATSSRSSCKSGCGCIDSGIDVQKMKGSRIYARYTYIYIYIYDWLQSIRRHTIAGARVCFLELRHVVTHARARRF